MSVFKTLSQFARGTYGVWSQLRRLNTVLEWNLVNGLVLTLRTSQFGSFQLRVEGSLPPSKKEIKEALGEEREYSGYTQEQEDQDATAKVVEMLKKRAKGVKLDDDDPGKDWEFL